MATKVATSTVPAQGQADQAVHRQQVGRPGRRRRVRDVQPGDRRGDRQGRGGRTRPTSTRPSRPPARPWNRARGARWTPPIAAGCCSSWPTWSSKNADELAALESLNCGKTITDSKGDMAGVVNTLRYYAGWADKIEGRTVPVRGNFLSYTLRQPVGVVGQIIPWNFPLLMLAWKWGPALACGNTVVMKPAEQTPLTGPAHRRAGPAKPASRPA